MIYLCTYVCAQLALCVTILSQHPRGLLCLVSCSQTESSLATRDHYMLAVSLDSYHTQSRLLWCCGGRVAPSSHSPQDVKPVGKMNCCCITSVWYKLTLAYIHRTGLIKSTCLKCTLSVVQHKRWFDRP